MLFKRTEVAYNADHFVATQRLHSPLSSHNCSGVVAVLVLRKPCELEDRTPCRTASGPYVTLLKMAMSRYHGA